jgi:hypothetical protein
MVELGHRTHEVVEVEFLEFEPEGWVVNLKYANDLLLRRLVGYHKGQSRTWSNLGRALISLKSKLKKSNKDFNNYKITVFIATDQ